MTQYDYLVWYQMRVLDAILWIGGVTVVALLVIAWWGRRP